MSSVMEIEQTPIEKVINPSEAQTAARPVIQLDHIHKTYVMGEVQVHALRGVSLTINEGEFVAIMGTSGSGKSTLMNTLGCLDRPTSGEYLLEGRDVAKMDRNQLAEVRLSTLGFVFQSFNLLTRTSALENVELPLVYAGVPAKERHQRAAEELARVGLGGRLDHHPSQLSGGQQQRVAIARAIVNQPRLILADEPTGNLHSDQGREIMKLFKQLNDQGTTIIQVTHSEENATYGTRTVRLADGVIINK